VCALPIAALALSVPVAPGGAVVDGDGAFPLSIAAAPGGGGYVYAADASPVDDHMIRVHLSSLGSPASVALSVGGSYTIQENGLAIAGAVTAAADPATGGISVVAGGVAYPLSGDILRKAATQKVTDYLSIGGKNYPGDLRIINRNGKLKIISHVDMETYVLGVVPYEAGNSKSYVEALKAQAVASRTFAYYVMNSRSRASQEHDVVNTTSSQVYNGYDAKYTYANYAVTSTACQLMQTPTGGNVFSCYSASNGGHTEFPKSSGAAGTNFKYLPYKDDPYDLNYALTHSSYSASVTIPRSISGKDMKSSGSQPCAMLRAAMAAAGADPAGLPDDAVVSVKQITLTNPRYTDNGIARAYTGATFTLGLPAGDVNVSFAPYVDSGGVKRPFLNEKLGLSNKSKFSLLYLRDNGDSYLLAAVRYGHSAGMSQIGAFQMAAEGKSYVDILKFYYLVGQESKIVTKDWPIDNGVTEGPMPVDESAVKSEKKDTAKAKVTAWSAKGYVKTKGTLNVRSGPSTSKKKIGSLKYKAKVTITGKTGSWYRIKHKSGSGYVMKKYIKVTSTSASKKKSAYPFKAKVNIKSSKLNVRSGAGTKYKALGSVKRGAKVTVKGAKGSWYKITYKKKTAYVLKKYLKKL
jgi:SpoIID/LytB domain protein